MLLQHPITRSVRRTRELAEGIFNVYHRPGSANTTSTVGDASAGTTRMRSTDAGTLTHVGSVLVKKADDNSATEHWVLFPSFVSPTLEDQDALLIERARPSDAAPTLPKVESLLMSVDTFLEAMQARAKGESARYTYLKVHVASPVELGQQAPLSPPTGSGGRRTRGLD